MVICEMSKRIERDVETMFANIGPSLSNFIIFAQFPRTLRRTGEPV